MAIADNKERVTVTLGKDLVAWCREEAEVLGVTVSFVVAMSLKQYKDMQTGMNLLKEVGGLNSLAVAVNEMNKREQENEERE